MYEIDEKNCWSGYIFDNSVLEKHGISDYLMQ